MLRYIHNIRSHTSSNRNMVINWSQVHKKKNRGNKDRKMKIDTQKPFHCPGIKTKYKEKLNNKTDKTWKSLTKVIKETAKEEIGLIKPKTKKIKKL